MKKRIKLLFFLVCSAQCFCSNYYLTNDLQSLYRANTSIYIYDLKNAKDIVKKDTNLDFSPASIQKLATAYSSLLLLGDNFKYITAIGIDGEVHDHKLFGDMWLKFSGDPTLNIDKIQGELLKIKNNLFDSISGNVILYNNDFDEINYGRGWMWDELDDCYAAPISANIINGNCVNAYISPALVELKPAYFELENELDQEIKVDIKTVKSQKKKCRFTFKRKSLFQDNYFLTGCVSLNKPEQKLAIAAHDSNAFAIKNIKSIIQTVGIGFRGNVYFNKKVPQQLKIVSNIYSPPLKDIINFMLKESNNLFAESIYKKIGQVYYNNQGSWESGHNAISRIFKKVNLPFEDDQLIDGSGLSRYNYISAEQVMKLLKTIHTDNKYKDTIKNSLPISGVDGTLTWMDSMPLKGKVHGKTGGMTGVYNLAGFFSTITSDYAYVILINGPPEKDNLYHTVAEKTLSTAILSL